MSILFAVGLLIIIGVRRPIRYESAPIEAGDYDHALHSDCPEAPSMLETYLNPSKEPNVGGAPKETGRGEEESE